jgi:hypothetical protein
MNSNNFETYGHQIDRLTILDQGLVPAQGVPQEEQMRLLRLRAQASGRVVFNVEGDGMSPACPTD